MQLDEVKQVTAYQITLTTTEQYSLLSDLKYFARTSSLNDTTRSLLRLLESVGK
jgi:hypothetical protein